ncbi:MAG: hypothetical protein RTU30_15015, partial [Candidatus Thorarchaeota archaeon]
MENIDKVLEALSVVERYEEYLFQRAWGRALIIIGVVFPLGIFINHNIQILASSTGLDTTLFLLIANIVTVLLCWGLVMSVFYNAWRTVTKDPELKEEGINHGVMIAIVWFVSFLIPSFVPEPFEIISILWASSIACLLSYLILRFTELHSEKQIVLYLGVMLGVVSIPLVVITDVILSGYLALIAFSVCFMIAGL